MSIRVTALSKSFGDETAVNGISFEIPAGAFFCVVGPSGCGKSTLLRLIAGLETPDAGAIVLDGETVCDTGLTVPPEDRHVGVVFQSYALWPHLSVLRNVAFPSEAKGVALAEATDRARAHLDTVSLTGLAGRRPEALSGGQRQRVALARCLAGNARTILMDEPLANLDPHLRHTMETELRAFHDRSGVTTLFITHDQREAMALADIMAVMERGRFLQICTPQEIYDQPRSLSVARFMGRGAVLPADMRNGVATVLGGAVPMDGHEDGPCTVFVRPRQIVIDPDGAPVTVSSVAYRGGHWEAEATTAQGAGTVTLKLNLDRPVRIGATLRVGGSAAWIVPES